jgi:AcrR family transcriptional regulator
VNTPWGDTEELRTLQLPRGRGSLGPSAWMAAKRRRFFAALVAAVAEKGYSEVSTRDLERLSGCGREEFYRVFRSKEDCLLQAVDSLYDYVLAQTAAHYAGGDGSWEQRMRAAVAALVEALTSQPAAARMCVVEVYAAGPEASRRVELALRRFERLVARAYREGGRAELPPALITAEVAGLEMFLHDRLHRGHEDALAEAVEGLLAWALSYEPPTEPLRRPRPRRAPIPEPPASTDPVERILRAVAEICMEEGVTRLTAQKIAPRAHVSLATLYKHFRGAEPAFLATFVASRDRALEAAIEAYAQESEWPEGLREAIAATYGYLADEPAFARVAMTEVPAAGPPALAARDEVLAPFVALTRLGLEYAPEVPEIVPELSTFAVYALAGRHIARRGSANLASLVPTATFIALAPFLGTATATEIANARPRRRRYSTAPSPQVGERDAPDPGTG